MPKHPAAAATRRLVLALATVPALPALARAQAAWTPDRPLRILVPFPAGGTADILARTVAERLSPRLGQPVVVENRPGAGGNIAAEAASRATPDGLTMLLGGTGVLSINAALYQRLPFDPVTAFAPVGVLADYANVLLVNPARRDFADLRALIAAARAEPGRIAYASNGPGSVTHLTAEMMRAAAGGIELLHVPYRGSAPGLAALLAGEVTMMFDGAPTASAQVRQGALKALAVTTPSRIPALPDVPTMAEAGLPGFEAGTWFGLFVPAATPSPALARLRAEAAAITADAGFRAWLAQQAASPPAVAVDGIPAMLAAERARWAEAVRVSGARAD